MNDERDGLLWIPPGGQYFPARHRVSKLAQELLALAEYDDAQASWTLDVESGTGTTALSLARAFAALSSQTPIAVLVPSSFSDRKSCKITYMYRA